MKTKTIDNKLKAALQAFSESWAAKRAASFEGLDFGALRDRLAERKDSAGSRYDDLAARFAEQASRHGSEVLWAKDGDEANRFVRDILVRHGAAKVVKSKSMVSEETGLNAFLSSNGIEPRETDLGEWIVQLAGEAPTHMVMPAIHLTRKGVAGIFSRKLGRKIEEDIPLLVKVAREEIRREILEAPAGLTGANALVAENGAIMLVTNEGNGRLVTTVPPLHIVLASTEKIVDTTADALLLLRILTRNATGQPVSSYVSFIAGPHRENQSIILLDNHRSELRADPQFRDVLRCIKCSACLNACPVYQIVGGEVFSHIYMGGIGSLLTAWVHGLEESGKLADLCMGCHRCEEVCATKIPIADLVVKLKRRLAEKSGKKFWKSIALDGVMGHPAVHGAAFGLGRAALPAIGRGGLIRRLPLWMGKYDRFRALPAPAPKPLSRVFREAGRTSQPPTDKSKGRVILFPGCLVQHVYPEVGMAATRVLGRLGYEVILGPSTCCGFPPWNSGHSSSARRAFRHVFERTGGEDPIVTLCPTCTSMLAKEGPDLLGEKRPGRPRRERRRADPTEADLVGYSRRVVTFSQFLARNERERLRALMPEARPKKRATYHDSCHHRHVLAAATESRDLVREACSRELVETEGPSACCGFAGAFCVDHPEVSEALLGDRLAAIQATGAEVVALDCPGCLLQLRGGLARALQRTEVRHTAEILDEVLKRS